jgi:hypothetical protein
MSLAINVTYKLLLDPQETKNVEDNRIIILASHIGLDKEVFISEYLNLRNPLIVK